MFLMVSWGRAFNQLSTQAGDDGRERNVVVLRGAIDRDMEIRSSGIGEQAGRKDVCPADNGIGVVFADSDIPPNLLDAPTEGFGP